MSLSHPLLLVALLATLVAGCGGDDDAGGDGDAADVGEGTESFEEEGFDVTFEYPADFEALEDVTFSRSAGSTAESTAAVGLDSSNLLALQRFELALEVTEDNLPRVQRESDALFSELAEQEVEGEQVEVGGLPALEYNLELDDPPDAETRAVAVFDGEDEYLLNCQSTPEQRERIEDACDLALETFEAR